MKQNHRLLGAYDGITRYAGVPTDQIYGRLHYNENLFGPSPKCMETLKELKPSDLYLYESNERDDLLDALSEELDIPVGNMFLNNGSAENIKSILGMIAKPGDTVLLPDPGWSYYYGLGDYKFLKVVTYPILEGEKKCVHDVAAIRRMIEEYDPRIAIITTPAMPTGNAMEDAVLEDIIRSYPDTLILVDEAYLGFRPYTLDVKRLIQTYDNLVFSRTFSKYYGLANLRIGYGICSTALKNVLWLDMPLHRLPHISKRMAIAALKDREYYDVITAELLQARQDFSDTLNAIDGILVYESDANFVYIKLIGYDVEKIKAIAAEHGYLIRIFTGNDEKHLRITIGPKTLMDDLTNVMLDAIRCSRL